MKRYVAIALLALVSISGCAGRPGGARGPTIQRTADDGSQRDHTDPTAPVFGQQR